MGSIRCGSWFNQLNADPRRGDDWASLFCRVVLDPTALLTLEKQAYTLESVPPPGADVLIHYNGEHMIDVTDEVHPEWAATAVLAARVVGLDIAGIDMIVPAIDRPLRGQKGMIVEVNAGPGLQMHLNPPSGKPRPVGEAILSTLFGDGQTGRIPTVVVTGATGTTGVSRLIAGMLEAAWGHVGLASAERLSIGGAVLECGPGDEGQRARAVLLHPDVERAVFEAPVSVILRQGLPVDRCSVAVVTGSGAISLPVEGNGGAANAEAVTLAAQLLVESLVPQTGTAVLNAQQGTAALAELCAGRAILFAEAGDEPALVAHRKQGGRGVLLRGDEIVVAQGQEEISLGTSDRVRRAAGVAEPVPATELLAATGALWAVFESREALRDWLDHPQSRDDRVTRPN